MPTVRRASLLTGITSRVCHGKRNPITTVKKGRFAPGTYLRLHENRWALHNNRLLLGAFEDLDQQTESDLLQIVEDTLGGIWEKSVSKREGRRDAMLDLIDKATPAMFRPARQIAPAGAKLLIEALSGRRCY